jgi:hypothetical protein
MEGRSIIPAARFGYGHPFWGEAVSLRQGQVSIQEILDRAVAAGYVDLRYHHIQHALRSAPADLHLPTVTSRWLRRRYEKISASFDAFQNMRDLTQEAMQKLAEIEDELADQELPSSRRMYLEGQLWRWFGRAFEYNATCAELAVRLQDLDGAAKPIVDAKVEEDVQAHLDRLTREFHSVIPVGRLDVVGRFGGDNVRLPSGREEEPHEGDEED